MSTRPVLDLTEDLRTASWLGTSVEEVDALLGEALEALEQLVPYDLATVMELDGDALRVRVARGRLDGEPVRSHRLPLGSFPSVRQALEQGDTRVFVEHDHADGDGDPFDGVLDLPHGHGCMVVPLRTDRGAFGAMTFDRTQCQTYPDTTVELASLCGKMLALAMSYGRQSSALERVREQLEEQNRLLIERIGETGGAGRQLERSASPVMRHVVDLTRRVSATDTPILVTGETGSGKELLARASHEWSPRRDRPMVSVNCAALPETLIESELFGHVKGAFTGATAARIGRFQTANGGTLFLDEVGDLPLALQAKLLRVLEDGTFEPVGSDRTVRVDVRIIAATNVDLERAVREGRFREDLYYRLSVFPIRIPPLRARREDVPVIANSFLASLSSRTGRGPWTLSGKTLEALSRRPWPGNVRELLNTLERATILAPAGSLDAALSQSGAPELTEPATRDGSERPDAAPRPLVDVERDHIVATLRHTGGKIHGPGGAAELLGMKGSTLASRMRKLGLGGARDHRPAR